MDAVTSLAPSSPARALAREVLIRGPISRADLASRLNLSVASLTRLSKPLLDAGVLRESDEAAAAAIGRPVRPLEISPDAHRFVGIKLTGDSAAAVATNLKADVVGSSERALPSHDVADVVGAIVEAVTDLGPVHRFSGMGVSIGGKVGTESEVLRAPFLNWRDVPLAALLHERTGLPVVVENDVVALTIAEQWFGAGRGEKDFAVLTIGAGVGYGLVINDAVIAPPDAGLGLVGHYPLDPSGPRCVEGHRGCSSGVLTIGSICSQFAAATGEQRSYAEILGLAAEGHPVAGAVVQGAGTALGLLVAAVANLTMVELIVLSGEGMDLADVAAASLQESIDYHRDPEAAPIRLSRQPSDFAQWARGAAAVAIQRTILGTLH
ncbi:ROK family transcriptional regulator [Arthrobacter sp. NamB2]|uniref:ROK family transcriptional regulator n=1 Tax=Arthrobacter sp. NamB2 TaxID=2576035 RepID=UPI0010C9F2DE|nr:ROK family transcriptional regulator [Arthrobacter sp. NamB2]TKV28493.1 ROK family transcriptional regulator [Arthrobacter sp. NamB2]